MTPEERANRVFDDWHAGRLDAHPREAVKQAIIAAIEEEREECAKALDAAGFVLAAWLIRARANSK
jgi:hypothetical protein